MHIELFYAARQNSRAAPSSPLLMNSSVAPNASKVSKSCIAFGFSGGDVQKTTGGFVGILLSSFPNAFGILVGVPGNILVILAISLNLRNKSDFVYLLLAVYDLLVSALLQPSLLARKVERLVLQRPRCSTVKVSRALFAIAGLGSLVSQMLVSLERTVAVLAPYWYEEWVTPAALIAPAVCVWFMLSLVLGILWTSLTFRTIAQIMVATFATICLLVTAVCSGILAKVANRHENQIVAQQQQLQLSEEERKKIKRERKALWTAIYVNVTFFVSYVPGVVAGLLTATIIRAEDEHIFAWSMIVGTAFLGFASAVNPIILYRRNARIGRQIRKLTARVGNHGDTAHEPAEPSPGQT